MEEYKCVGFQANSSLKLEGTNNKGLGTGAAQVHNPRKGKKKEKGVWQ